MYKALLNTNVISPLGGNEVIILKSYLKSFFADYVGDIIALDHCMSFHCKISLILSSLSSNNICLLI